MNFFKKFFGESVSWSDAEKLMKTDPNELVKKWITVYFSIYFQRHENDKKEGIENIAIDLTSIVNNTHSLFAENGEFLGCINPYLQINALFSESGIPPHLKRDFINHLNVQSVNPQNNINLLSIQLKKIQ